MKSSGTNIIVSFIVCIMVGGPAFAGLKDKLIRFATRSSTNNQATTVEPMLDSDSEICLECHNK